MGSGLHVLVNDDHCPGLWYVRFMDGSGSYMVLGGEYTGFRAVEADFDEIRAV